MHRPLSIEPYAMDTSALMEQAQRENRKAVCPACGVAQTDHWMCACCSARGHHIPRSPQMPAYCQWCVDDGCAQQHQDSSHQHTTTIRDQQCGEPPEDRQSPLPLA